MPIGLHVSIAGGLHLALQRAERLGCETVQIFSRNPRSWIARKIDDREIETFRSYLEKANISPLILHTPYLINLASPNHDIYSRSIGTIREDMVRGYLLGADFLVTHIGSTKGKGIDFGIERVIEALSRVLMGMRRVRPKVLLEISSGSGYHIGKSLEEMARLISPFKETGCIGFCLDTCHAFAAGYPLHTPEDIDSLVEEIDRLIGIDNLLLLHINDSKGDLGSNVDLHEHIGKGKIGLKGFRLLIKHPLLRRIPMIL